jgi:hypothetical protein
VRPIFFTVITISRLSGALLAFGQLDQLTKQGPLTRDQQIALAVIVLVYLPGLIGSILIWVRRRTGIWLSLIHQILLIPLFIIPNVYFYSLTDAVGVAVGLLLAAGHLNVNFAFNIGADTLISVINPPQGASYYGVNAFALICALYLNKLRRPDRLAQAMTDGGMRAIDLRQIFARMRGGEGRVLRRPFLILITISQLVGVLLTLGVGILQILRAPQPASSVQRTDLAIAALIYLPALIGSILIWARAKAGLWLSLAHQIFIVPVVVLPSVFTYAMGDAANVAVAVGTGTKIDYRLAVNFGGNLLPQLQPSPGALNYYGVNLTALICALYLIALQWPLADRGLREEPSPDAPR